MRSAHAQTASESIESFATEITVNADGSADFTETIDYNFGANEHHGIERILVTTTRYDDQNDRRYPLSMVRAAATDAPSQTSVADVGGGRERIRIGDPNRTITGRHVYSLRYRLERVVNKQDGDDEFYWNVTGDEWRVPITRISVTVRVPAGATKVVCFAGVAGGTSPCDAANVHADGTAAFTHSKLDPGQGLTVVAGIHDHDGPEREPAPLLVHRDAPFSYSKAFRANPLTVGTAALLGVVLTFGIGRLQWRFGRDRRAIGAPADIAFATAATPSERVPLGENAAIPVEFVPPDGIRPGQLGVLKDQTAHTVDVSATLVDLAVRGYLRIDEVTGANGKVHDYRLERSAKNDGLLDYEHYLLRELFDSGPVVDLSSLKNKFAASVSHTKEMLYADAVQQGWFDRRPDQVRMLWHLIGGAVAIVGGVLTFLLARYTYAALIGVPFVFAGLALFVGARWMPCRTAKGTGVYRRIRGFEDFVEHSEKHRAQWAERRHLFSEYLPYAIAFGATTQWAHTLETLGAPAPDTSAWYVGTSPLAWQSLGDRIGDFSAAASSTLTSSPGGSGGSGFGGGSAGGGGGGGGGGSW